MLQSCCRSCQIRTILLKISVRVGFVSKFQIYGQRKVELATQLRISVACGTQHISVCAEGFLDFCSHAKIIGWLSPVIVHKLTAASSMEQWTCHWQSEKWRYERMRIILTCSTCIWYGSRNLGTAFMLQLCGNIFYFDFSPVGMNPYQTDVVTHRNSGVPVNFYFRWYDSNHWIWATWLGTTCCFWTPVVEVHNGL